MPELPEVETHVRLLRPDLVGRTIREAQVLWPRTVASPSPREFCSGVRGRAIRSIWRRAKYFVLELDGGPKRDGGRRLVGHLRMTGRLYVAERNDADHARAWMALDDGRYLVFVDVRKFGRLALVRALDEVLPALGPEPLAVPPAPDDVPVMDADWFASALRRRRRQLKPLLLDQSFVAGLGNIYVDESLHKARLHPLRSSETVSRKSALLLADTIHDVLGAAIAAQGSSFDAFYRTPEGKPGSFQDEFTVYDRQGQPCTQCGGTIRKIVVGQRGTHLCPRCQRAPRRKVGGAR